MYMFIVYRPTKINLLAKNITSPHLPYKKNQHPTRVQTFYSSLIFTSIVNLENLLFCVKHISCNIKYKYIFIIQLEWEFENFYISK